MLLLNFCTFVTLFRIKIALLADFWQLSSDAQSATAFAANAFDAASHATFNSIVRRELISMELKCSLSCETASHGLRANHNGVPLLLHSACVCFGICLQKLKCLHLIEARGFLSSLFPNRQIYYHFVPLFAHLFNESCGSPLNSQWTIDNTVLYNHPASDSLIYIFLNERFFIDMMYENFHLIWISHELQTRD